MEFILQENSLYTSKEEYEELLKDKEKIADALIFNLFGFISLFSVASRRDVKAWKNNEKRVRVEKINEENTDVTISIKLAHDARMLPRSTVDKLTRMLSLIKQNIISKPVEVNDDLIHDLFVLCKFDTINKPSTKLRPVVEKYINREINISFLARNIYRLSKLNEFKEISKEFFAMYKNGQYQQIYMTLETGQAHAPLGIPVEHVQKVTDKTVFHKVSQTVDRSGLNQVIKAIKTANHDNEDNVEQIEQNIINVVDDNKTNPVNVVLPKEEIKFDPYKDETQFEFTDVYGLKSLATERLKYGEKLIKAGFNFDNAISSQEGFIEEYINTFLMHYIQQNPLNAIKGYYIFINKYITDNDIDRPEFILDDSDIKPNAYYKLGKDSGTYQALFVVHLSYYFAWFATQKAKSFVIDDLYQYFKKAKEIKNIIGGNKAAKEQTFKLIQTYAAKINFGSVMDVLLEFKTPVYSVTIFKFMFAKIIFDILLNEGDYKLDKRFWFIKELNSFILDEKVLPTHIKEFYSQFESNLFEKKIAYFVPRYRGVLLFDDSYSDYVLPIMDGLLEFFLMPIKRMFENYNHNPETSLRFISDNYEQIKNISFDEMVKLAFHGSQFILESAIIGLKGTANTSYNNKAGLQKIVNYVLTDIVTTGKESKFLTNQVTNGVLMKLVTDPDLNKEIDPTIFEKLKNNIIEIEELYKASKLAPLISNNPNFIKENIEIFERGKTLFELNFKSDIESFVHKNNNNSSIQAMAFCLVDDVMSELNNHGSFYNSGYIYDVVEDAIKQNIHNRNALLNFMESLFKNDKTGKLIKLSLDTIDDPLLKKDVVDMITNRNLHDDMIENPAFIDLCQEYPTILDDFNLDFKNQNVVTVRGTRIIVGNSKDGNARKFIEYYIDKLFNEELNGIKMTPEEILQDRGRNLDVYQKFISSAIIMGYADPNKYIDLSSVEVGELTKSDIIDKLDKSLDSQRINEVSLKLLKFKSQPDVNSYNTLENMMKTLESFDDDDFNSTAKFFLEDAVKSVITNYYTNYSLEEINSLPSKIKQTILSNVMIDSYEEILEENISDVREMLDTSSFDLMRFDLSDEELVKISKVNGIGLSKFKNIDLTEFNSKEEFEQKSLEIINQSFKDDTRKNSEMNVVDILDDEETLMKETKELYSTSNGRHGNVAPIVKKVYTINMDRTKFDEFVEKDKLNPNSDSKGEIRTFMIHGTGSIATTFISKFGFREIPMGIGLYTTGKMLGPGIYLAENIEKSLSYIGDSDFAKTYKEGYIFIVDACLGEYNVDYMDGRNHPNLVSPEWCVRGFETQILVKKIIKLESVTLQNYKDYIS